MFSKSRFAPPAPSLDWVLQNEKAMTFSVSREGEGRGVPIDPLEEVMIFGVSRGAPTDPLKEVIIFGVSRGVPTDPFEEVMTGGLRGAIKGSDHFT